MPELPEMETYRTLLSERLNGKQITDVEIKREKSINVPPAQFANELIGNKIEKIDRRGKHLVFRVSTGKNLLLHLMLGGWMYIGTDDDSPDRTKQVIISFGEMKLFFIGLRLGYLHLLTDDEVTKDFSDLGPEPLSEAFNEQAFLDLFKKKKGMLKTTLVDQKFIAGIGNCYSDEICYASGIRPMQRADQLQPHDLNNLYKSMHLVLRNATDHGGYMDDPLFKGDEKTGGYNKVAYVYDREGEPCRRCKTPIVKETISSRKAFYCPVCQKG